MTAEVTVTVTVTLTFSAKILVPIFTKIDCFDQEIIQDNSSRCRSNVAAFQLVKVVQAHEIGVFRFLGMISL